MENWCDIRGYAGWYMVSDWGRIWSVPRTRPKPRGVGRQRIPGRYMKLGQFPSGYVSVGLSRDGVVKNYYVHRLVCDAFVRPLTGTDEVNHEDGNKANNKLSNLTVGTRRDNYEHAVRNKLNKIVRRGSLNLAAKLNEASVLDIRRRLAEGVSGRALAKEYGVSFQLISNIKWRKSWTHI